MHPFKFNLCCLAIGVLLDISGCAEKDSETVLATVSSPDRQARAELVRVVHEGTSVPETSITDVVRILEVGANSQMLVFAVDTDDGEAERPSVAWRDNKVLEITIRRGMAVGRWVTRFSRFDVDVDVN